MNTAVLIEALVRQTTVLIATLATAAGQRATLSRIADQVFADLVRELNDQGVGHKVIAGMFGMALRTYHDRVARVGASRTDQGRSLWEAVLTHAGAHGPITRAQLHERFANDDDATVRGVLIPRCPPRSTRAARRRAAASWPSTGRVAAASVQSA